MTSAKPKNILYHHRIASKDGQYVHVEEIVSALRRAGHTVNIVAPNVSEGSDFGHDGGWVSKLKSRLPKWVYEILELGYSGWLFIKLFFSVLKNKPDAIYERYNLYQPAGVIISKLFRIPLLLEVNAPLFEERSRYSGGLGLPKLAKWIEHFTWKHATVLLPVTNVLANIITEQTKRTKNIAVIHNGIRTSAFESMQPNPWEIGQPVTIGFVGFMHLTCGVEHILTLMAENPELPLRLVCIGDGPRALALKDMSEKLGLVDRAAFKGLITRDQIFDEVSRFHIAVQPAVTAYASPLKMFEYMSAQSLIVAPSQDNIREILDEKCALFFSPGDAESFKAAVQKAALEFGELQELRKQARNRIVEKGFSWENNAARIVELMDEQVI